MIKNGSQALAVIARRLGSSVIRYNLLSRLSSVVDGCSLARLDYLFNFNCFIRLLSRHERNLFYWGAEWTLAMIKHLSAPWHRIELIERVILLLVGHVFGLMALVLLGYLGEMAGFGSAHVVEYFSIYRRSFGVPVVVWLRRLHQPEVFAFYLCS